jgi:hypothetical protein
MLEIADKPAAIEHPGIEPRAQAQSEKAQGERVRNAPIPRDIPPSERATAHDWQRLLSFLPGLRISESERARMAAGIREQLDRETVLEPLGNGRWRIGQGNATRIYSDAPAVLAVAHKALQGQVQHATDKANAMRNRLRRAASWLERDARAPLLAKKLRRVQVITDQRGRVLIQAEQ